MADVIIVPLDDSALAATAVPVATHLSDRLAARLVLIAVGGDTRGKDLRTVLDAQVQKLAGRVVEAVLVPGHDPAQGIGAFAATRDNAVICMTSHGRGGLRWAVLGSVAGNVVETSPCPVMLVGPRCDPEWAPGAGPVLLCNDGSEVRDSVVDSACRWATDLGVDILVATIIHPLDAEDAERPARLFTELESRIRARGVAVTHELQQRHYPAGALVDLAQDRAVSIIVVASHDRSAVERALLGSTAMAIVHLAPCPVVVTRRTFDAR